MRVLLVDHDPAVLSAAARALQGLIDCAQVTSKSDCLARLREGGYDIVVACERLADGSGLDLLATLGLSEPDVLRIFAADGERLKKLGGHLAPFKLFDTIGYPLESMQLRSAMALAIAERGDLMSGEFENIVLGSDTPPEGDNAGETAIEALPQIVLLTRDSSALESANAALDGKPYRVIAARDADEARADLVARQPVLALVDVGTLGMDPVNWFVEAHRASAATLLIALGRRNDGQALEPLVADGVVNRFVAKPVTLAGMRLVLDSALRLQSLNAARPAPAAAAASPPSATPFGDEDSLAGPVVRTGGTPLRTVDWQPADPLIRKGGGMSASRPAQHPGRLPLPAMLAMAGALAFGAAWFYFSRNGDPAAVPETQARTVAPAPAAPSPGDQLVAQIESALNRGDAAAAQASLDQLLRVAPQHERRLLLATLVARAEETQRLAKAPPRNGATAVGPAPAVMATTSITPGATLPATAPANAAPPAVESAPVATPVDAPAPAAPEEPSTVAAASPAASPTNLRPSKLTAVSFAGRTLEDSTAPAPVTDPAPPPAPTPARTEPDRPKPVVMEMKLLRSTPPEYPDEARRRKLEGSVDLAFIVGADGKVKDIEVAGSSAPGVFDAQAIAAVKHWRYDPRREDGVPVDHPAKVRLQFRLDE
ncbi:MAG: TonB family protein [Steroidobacteraceae bacterium]